MAKRSGLGKGLNALFDDNMIMTPDEKVGESVTTVRISDIEPDKTQPRKIFEPEALSTLADSISRHGILQPIVVRRPEGEEPAEGEEGTVAKILRGKYKIVAGERRWRAAKMAGLTEVPVIVKSFTEKEAAAIMLVENLQREDLNPVEQAMGLQRLMQEFELTQEEAAQIVGISRPALSNALRLLSLPKDTLSLLEDGSISSGHARALLGLGRAELIDKCAKDIFEKDLSVRDTERLVKLKLRELEEKEETEKKKADKTVKAGAAYLGKIESSATSILGRRVKIVGNAKKPGEGRLELHYYNNKDLEDLLKSICGDKVFPED
ncbi:MAG: ParB/RepB/Spo0J family partition protein [Ruminococcaceae bacterium]|nr:ParB/RepB/Spo0J family partition protein [Oscillospiraceae bacterium]